MKIRKGTHAEMEVRMTMTGFHEKTVAEAQESAKKLLALPSLSNCMAARIPMDGMRDLVFFRDNPEEPVEWPGYPPGRCPYCGTPAGDCDTTFGGSVCGPVYGRNP